ncbi:MAG: aminopeptidase P family N-terminal domain-containing protein, partial [Gaiellaceae bacterium]
MAEIPGTEIEPGFDEMLAAAAGVDLSSFTVASKTAKFAEFPLEEYTARYAKACRLMEHEGLDAVLVTQDLNVRYFTGYLSILWASRFRPYVAILP